MADLSAIADTLSSLTSTESHLLVKQLEEKWGVSAAAPKAAPVAQAPVAAVQTEFSVTLTGVSASGKKVEVIKEVRTITGLGLKEAKDLVDGLPKVLKDSVSKEEAAKIQEQLAKVGATVEIK